MVCLDGSGNNKTFSPLANLYSVIPSAEVTFSGIGKEAAGAATVCFAVDLVAVGFCWAIIAAVELTNRSPARIILFMVLIEC
jgi:hypothetical protein